MARPPGGPETALLSFLHMSRGGANFVGNFVLRTVDWVQTTFSTPPAPAEAIDGGWEVVVDDGTLTGSDGTSELEDRYDDNGGLFDGEPITGGYTLAEYLSDYISSDGQSEVDSPSDHGGRFSNRWEPELYERTGRIIKIDSEGRGKSIERSCQDDGVQSNCENLCSGHPGLHPAGDQAQTDTKLTDEDGDKSDSDNDAYVDARSHVESEHSFQNQPVMVGITSELQSPKPLQFHRASVAGCDAYRKLEALLRARVAALWENVSGEGKATMVVTETGAEAKPENAPTVAVGSSNRTDPIEPPAGAGKFRRRSWSGGDLQAASHDDIRLKTPRSWFPNKVMFQQEQVSPMPQYRRRPYLGTGDTRSAP
ncbi:hypothetical protein VTH82DRAFT_1483 [Thermothelomyces myriococcoides]